MNPATEQRPAAPAWDPIVRLTHWCVAFGVILNALIVEDESLVHIWIGYGVIAFVTLRLLWGVIGTEEARFTAFPPSPSAAMAHVRDLLAGRHRSFRSHNPLGALMVYALWGMIVVVVATGVTMESDPFPPTYHGGFFEAFGEIERPHGSYGFLKEIHEVAANMLLFLAALHVVGVALESRLSGVNLVRAMVSGRKRTQDGE